MGASERRKGYREELNVKHTWPGYEKTSRAWAAGTDGNWRGREVEIKYRTSGFTQLYRWLEDAAILLIRASRKERLVVMRQSELFDLMDEEYNRGRASQ